MTKEIYKPQFCPVCGEPTSVVRHVMNNMFELDCSTCEQHCVVLVNDSVKLPQDKF
jgi:hypothetical protein